MLPRPLQFLIFIITSFCNFANVQSNDDAPDPFAPLINLDCYPSSIVNGTVNTISGSYCEQTTDLLVPGPEPLVFTRASINDQNGWLYKGWTMNQHAAFHLGKYGHIWSGKFSSNYPLIHDPQDPPSLYKIDLGKLYSYGGTNCGSGEISGKNNLKNCQLHLNPAVKSICFGDGSTQEYRPPHRTIETPILSKETKANGNQIHYHYDHNGAPTKIETKNSKDNTNLAWATYADSGDKTRTITANNGSFVRYDILRGPLSAYQLSKVTSSENPDIEYTYHGGELSGYLHKKILPEGRFIETEYYQYGANDVGGTTVNLRSDKIWQKYLHKRVKLQKAPVGPNGKPIIISRFFYHVDTLANGEVHKGHTEVYDPYDNKEVYHFSPGQQLSAIEYYLTKKPQKSYSLERKDCYFWQEDGGTLQAHAIQDSNGHYRQCKIYHYDKQSNISEEILYGNLTGQNTNPVKLQANGNISPLNSSDNYKIRYTYSKDNFNLMLSKHEDNGTNTYFDYKPGSNLLKSQLVYEGNSLRQRNFYEYDNNGTLIKVIVDDCPHNADSSCVTNTTERRVTLIRPRQSSPGFGQKEWLEEYYYDFTARADKLLKKIFYVYGEKDRLTRTDIYGSDGKKSHSISYSHDDKGRVTKEADSRGKVWEYTYDANGNNTFSLSPAGVETHYTYDLANRLTQEEEKSSVGSFVKRFSYDYNGNRISSEDEYGNTTHFEYDSLSRLIKITHPQVPDIRGNAVTPNENFAYDVFHNKNLTVDANGNRTTSSYTVRGQPAAINYPDGTRELFEYNVDGSLKKKTEKNGSYYIYTRDYQGRAYETRLYTPSGKLYKHTKASYSTFNLLSSTDGKGNTSSYHYDGAGRLIAESKGQKHSSYAYDAMGNCCQIVRKYGTSSGEISVEKKEHDPFGRLILKKILNNKGIELEKVAYEYDINDNPTKTIQFTASKPIFELREYNQRNEPIRITDPCGHVTNIAYNYTHRNSLGKYSRSQTTTDPNGRSTEIIVDALHRVEFLTVRNINGHIIDSFTYRYDNKGNKTKELHNVYTGNKKRHSIQTSWQYGPCNRLEQLTEAALTKDQRVTTYSYNRSGELWKTCKANGVSLTRSYNPRGLLSNIISSDGSINDSYTYDKEDNLLVLKDHIHNRETHREYDCFNRICKERLDNGLESHYTYDLLDRNTGTYLADGSSIIYHYDAAHMQSVTRKDTNGRQVYKHSYLQYNLSGKLLKEHLIRNSGEQSYQRDHLGRCVRLNSTHLNWSIPHNGFDRVGNLRTINVKDPNGDYQGTYRYDENYHLSNESGVSSDEYEYDSRNNRLVKNGQSNHNNWLDALVRDAQYNYAYDHCGNMIQKSSTSSSIQFRYDAYDRLIEASEADNLRVTFDYDGLHRRTRKQIFSWDKNSSSWTLTSNLLFIYQNNREIGATDVERDIVELRVLGKGSEIGTAIAVELDGKAYLPVHNHRGSITALVDIDTNTVVESYRHNAFGEEQVFDSNGDAIEGSLIGNPWRYSSKRMDEETGLVFFGRRYYSPDTGKWITTDPAGFKDGPNLHAYVHGNPLKYVDLYGLKTESDNATIRDTNFGREVSDRKGSSLSNGKGGRVVTRHDAYNDITGPTSEINKLLALSNTPGNKQDRLNSRANNYYMKSGKGEASDHVRVMFTPGQLSRMKDSRTYADLLSEMYGGNNIHTVINPTGGVANDVCESVAYRTFSIETEVIVGFVNIARDLIDEVGGVNGKGTIISNAFSQGAIIERVGLELMSPQERGMFVCHDVGPGCINSTKMAREVTSYVSKFDPVPYTDILGMLSPHSNIQYLKPGPGAIPGMDHGMFNSTYGPVWQDLGKDFTDQYGVTQ